jgi:hypothetical protein
MASSVLHAISLAERAASRYPARLPHGLPPPFAVKGSPCADFRDVPAQDFPRHPRLQPVHGPPVALMVVAEEMQDSMDDQEPDFLSQAPSGLPRVPGRRVHGNHHVPQMAAPDPSPALRKGEDIRGAVLPAIAAVQGPDFRITGQENAGLLGPAPRTAEHPERRVAHHPERHFPAPGTAADLHRHGIAGREGGEGGPGGGRNGPFRGAPRSGGGGSS